MYVYERAYMYRILLSIFHCLKVLLFIVLFVWCILNVLDVYQICLKFIIFDNSRATNESRRNNRVINSF